MEHAFALLPPELLAAILCAVLGLLWWSARTNVALKIEAIERGFAVQHEHVAAQATRNGEAITLERQAREGDSREIRGILRDIEKTQQGDALKKVELEGRILALQGSVDQQADALEKQTTTIMEGIRSLDYRKASRGEMPAIGRRDSRVDLDDEPPPAAGPGRTLSSPRTTR